MEKREDAYQLLRIRIVSDPIRSHSSSTAIVEMKSGRKWEVFH